MTEKTIVKAIQRYVKKNGGKCYKLHGSRYQTAGAPDLIGIVQGTPFVVEVKRPISEGGKQPTKLQQQELFEWGEQGFACWVVRSLGEFQELVDPRERGDDGFTPTAAQVCERVRIQLRTEAIEREQADGR